MAYLVWLVLGLFALKLIWNLTVPFVLLGRLRANPDGPRSGISMASGVEVLLLLVAVGLSAISVGEYWVNRPLLIAGWGSAAILFTYVAFYIVGAIGGWFVTRKLPRSPDSSSKS